MASDLGTNRSDRRSVWVRGLILGFEAGGYRSVKSAGLYKLESADEKQSALN